ncbi:MAG: folate-binding protein YgfZ [Steroidobacteraceae bacterium]|nr:folate-binding protein YgfZ [Steroidobacteraceae bacterium]
MLNGLDPRCATHGLPDFGAVLVRGPDRVRFLQGQLSNDIEQLTPERSLLAGLHNAQGRTIALLRLIAIGSDEVIAVLPRELAGPVTARLAKYVFRAQVKVSDVSDGWRFAGVVAQTTPGEQNVSGESASSNPMPEWPATVNAQIAADGSFIVRVADAPARWIVASSNGAAAGADESSVAVAATTRETGSPASAVDETSLREAWRALDVAAGLPQVYAATSEAFVAQMLNLDAIGAISFTKGCYTGQEVIARAHYRGRVKRRMQRFRTTSPAQLAPGDAGQLRDGRAFRVVDAVRLSDGRCEFLAVAPVSPGDGDDAPEASASSTTLETETLPLPYELPER